MKPLNSLDELINWTPPDSFIDRPLDYHKRKHQKICGTICDVYLQFENMYHSTSARTSKIIPDQYPANTDETIKSHNEFIPDISSPSSFTQSVFQTLNDSDVAQQTLSNSDKTMTLKCILLGDSNVGKSSLVISYTSNEFHRLVLMPETTGITDWELILDDSLELPEHVRRSTEAILSTDCLAMAIERAWNENDANRNWENSLCPESKLCRSLVKLGRVTATESGATEETKKWLFDKKFLFSLLRWKYSIIRTF